MPRQFCLCVCPSVCLSRAWFVSKGLNASSKFFHHLKSPSFYFFVTKGPCTNLGASPPMGAPIFVPIFAIFESICGYISETVIDRGIVTMEDEYKVVCALTNSAAFDDFEWPRTPVSRSQYSLKANISQTLHLIHSMFGSRLWFSVSADQMALFGYSVLEMAYGKLNGHVLDDVTWPVVGGRLSVRLAEVAVSDCLSS